MGTELIISWAILLAGTSLIFKTSLWINLIYWMKQSQNKELLFFSLSWISLTLGLLIVAHHNIWELNPLVIVTIIGWGSLLKGLVHIFFPQVGIYICELFFKQEEKYLIWSFRIIGSFYMILGVTVLSYIS